jgi:PelA/Pel-15E family pectate lyase
MNFPLVTIALLLSAVFATAIPADLLRKPDEWFKSSEGMNTTANILSWQSIHGSWPKNQDNTRKAYAGDRGKLSGTFDNGATTDELRYLARAFRAANDAECKKALLSGLDHILKAQYPNGGWPQYFPLSKQYHRHITFNDNTMVRLLEFLREVATGDDYAFAGPERLASAGKAFDRGVACILKCQVMVNGQPTVWCAQHDEVTLKPAAARSYELPSLSGSESAGILRFLMSLEKPAPEVIRAVKAGVAWFESSKVEGLKIEKIDGVRTVVTDPQAPAMWARFYDLETNRPFFCDRDGVKKWNYNEIGRERRNGYAWFGNWGESVIKTYQKWPQR